MSHSLIEIRDGAFIISDAHYSHARPELFSLIESIYLKKLSPPQLFLFGDIFDALFGSISKTFENNKVMIEMIQSISQNMEVVYLEGNHDFNLQKVFPDAKVFPIKAQPIACSFKEKKVLIAHGDFGEDLGYKIYTSIIRNRYLLPVFNLINTLCSNYILNKLDAYLGKKEDCNEFTGFRKYIAKRLEGRFDCKYFIEGHFHQNKSINFDDFIYINLAAFACNQRYFIVELNKDKLILKESIFHKET